MKKGILIILIVLLSILGIYFLNNSTGNAILTKDKFCGRSSFAYCTANNQCIPSGCGNQLCGATTEYKTPARSCKTKTCFNAAKYNLECICYRSLCQWKNQTSLSG